MKTPTLPPILTAALTLGLAGVFQFATPLALCGQERGTLSAQATVVAAEGAWLAHDLVQRVLRTGAAGGDVEDETKPAVAGGGPVPGAPSRGEHLPTPAEIRDAGLIGPVAPEARDLPRHVTEAGAVVLQRDETPRGPRITVSDLGR